MPIAVGQPAPDFTLKNQDNRDWTLSDHRGKTVVFLWYALDWSPTCEKENCKVGREIPLAADEDTVVVGVSRDSVWSHKAWKEARRIEHDLLSDPDLSVTKKYGLVHPQVPYISQRATVIVDPDGKVAWAQVQENTKEERDWQAVQKALREVAQGVRSS